MVWRAFRGQLAARRSSLAFALLLAAASSTAACVYNSDPAPGGLRCGSGAKQCPDGFECYQGNEGVGCEGTCWPNGTAPSPETYCQGLQPDGGSTTDAPSPDGSDRVDAPDAAGDGGTVESCEPMDKRCNPAAPVIQQCDFLGIWRDTPTVCPFLCSGTGATTACTGTCRPGSSYCGPNETPYLCDPDGASKPQTPCPSICTGAGTCAGECKPGATRCQAGATNMVETCDATGQWGPAEACTFVCDRTADKCGGECVPGSANRCAGNALQACDPSGHWTTTTTCSPTCSRGQCRACTSGEKQCNGDKPQTCSPTGVWIDDQASACQFVCDASSGRCGGECVPGTDACASGNTTKHCGANGLYTAATTCTNVCDMTTGRCGGVCASGDHRCSGDVAQTCGGTGTWSGDASCVYGCDATSGECKVCVDDPMSKTCAGSKCGSTMNNCGRSVTCPSCLGAGESCGGGGVAGVCGCRPETKDQTCQNGQRCGAVLNNCGQMVECGNDCAAPQTCGGGGTPNACGCTPMSTAAACAGKNCSTVADGCGGTINCGDCAAPETCGGDGTPGRCGCTPATMSAACGSRNCGPVSDGCGGTFTCGTCSNGQVCADGTCQTGCTPITACPTGKNCGTMDNGCGTQISCGGTCPTGQTCGGGNPGVANVCGCTPMTMAAACAGKNCNTVSNGCGGTISCGTCSAPQTCGGGGTQNVCGCTPLTMAAACAGKNCGTVSNGCGGSITCGTCTAPQTCEGGGTPNVCGCTPLTAAVACPAGQNCGTAPDGCGGNVSCGTCTAPQTCGGGGTPTRCGCTPVTTCGPGTNCGTIPNGCGTGTVSCGTASCGTGTNQQCGATTPNLCGCTRNAMATTCSGKCGMVADNCGTIVDCGTATCAGQQVCAKAPSATPNVCCTPETDIQMCARLGKNCGSVTGVDNCGTTRTITTCGACAPPLTCGASNVCGCTSETDAAFCARLGKNCGTVSSTDNCGGARSVNCGTCPNTQVCETASAPAPNTCCLPETAAQMCARFGKNCDSFTGVDNCGTSKTVSCGTCTGTGQLCGGGSPGAPNVCGCTAESTASLCSRLGRNCGTLTAADNCGTQRTVTSCGTCSGTGQTCSGGGVTGVCGCTSAARATTCSGKCGIVTDNCGVAVNCGACNGQPCTTGSGCASLFCVGFTCCANSGVACNPDSDGDGYGDKWVASSQLCGCPVGFAPNALDCQDKNAAVNPSATFKLPADGMYAPDPRDTSPDGWDYNCNDVRDFASLPPYTVQAGCVASGQGACAAGCMTASGTNNSLVPCGGFLAQAACASMGCGITNAPGCGSVSIQTAPQACR